MAKGEPTVTLETIGKVTFPLRQPSISIGAGLDPVPIGGWAVDAVSGSNAAGVNVVIDGKRYPARFGVQREDVAAALKRSSYSYSGFECSVPASALAKGAHTISIHVISNDGSRYFATPESKLTIN